MSVKAGLAPSRAIPPAVEKKEPYRCGVWQVAEDSLASAQRENEAAIGRLLRCEETGIWISDLTPVFRRLDAKLAFRPLSESLG